MEFGRELSEDIGGVESNSGGYILAHLFIRIRENALQRYGHACLLVGLNEIFVKLVEQISRLVDP